MKLNIVIMGIMFFIDINAQNLINNPNFSNGTKTGQCLTKPWELSNFNGIDDWEIAFHDPNCSQSQVTTSNTCKTPDWILADMCINDPDFITSGVFPSSTAANQKFIGLAYTESNNWVEGIRCKLNRPAALAGGNVVRISFKIANSVNVAGAGSITKAVLPTIVFSKFAEHWNSSPSTTANVKWEIVDQNLKIEANQPHEWFHKEIFVPVPDMVDGGNPSELENIIIFFDGETTGIDAGYIFIDDLIVETVNPCKSFCTPVCAVDTPKMVIDDGVLVTEENFTFNSSDDFPNIATRNRPFAINMKNVTNFEFRIVDSQGGVHDIYKAKNVNCLVDAGFDNFTYAWSGQNSNGGFFPIGSYTAMIKIANCSHKWEYNDVPIQLELPGPMLKDMASIFVNKLNSCCVDFEFLNNIVVTNKFRKDVNIAVEVGVNGPVTFENNSDVLLVAGERITLGPNLTVKPQATFRTKLASCGFGKSAPVFNVDTLLMVDAISEHALIYPNPASEYIYINYNQKLEKKVNNIEFIDLIGNVVYKTAFYSIDEPINVSGISSGLYFVKFELQGKMYYEKLFIK